ncbi:hypothetical protein CDD81_2291 [Ophiocordyceps australis]|uniref:DUF7603 domain-containing protein n=1 Tax=Ophiocordyceps australis TaxID=1399860 RepID=A0A2C5YF62_9HYPO|nr:hypothetical protein CDD81_2291 [Ophiocordyceps australis]
MASSGPAPMASSLTAAETASASSDLFQNKARRHGPPHHHHSLSLSSPAWPSHTPPRPQSRSRAASGSNILGLAANSLLPLSSSSASCLASLPLRSSAPTLPCTLVKPSIRRKPLSSTASLSLSLSPPASLSPSKPDQRFSRPPTVDSPTLYDYCSPLDTVPPPLHESSIATTLPDSAESHALCIPSNDEHVLCDDYGHIVSQDCHSTPRVPNGHASSTKALDHSFQAAGPLDTGDSHPRHYSQLLHMHAPRPVPPHLILDKVDSPRVHGDADPFLTTSSFSPDSAHLNKPLPLSPRHSSPLASFFGWRNSSPTATEVSSIPSPLSFVRTGSADDALHPNSSSSTTSSKAHGAQSNPINYCESYLCTPPPLQASSSSQIEEMEEELKAISSELAASIRREMDLEDLVDKLQDHSSNSQAPGKRTSDYFSDSGYSSAKTSEYEQNREEIDKIQRRSEQEKASIRLELTTKLQDERTKRKDLDAQIKHLADKASRVDLVQINNLDANDRVRDLENTCEDLRRKLSEERDSKSNFEDLLSALKGELKDTCNQRDNLRDEVIPQLRARVEGLESEAASYANLTYESTKMQQQLQSLQRENTALRNTPNSASDEAKGLSRSNSVAASSFRPRAPPGLNGLSRSDSVKNTQTESREHLAERLKDVEAQRDALHRALKSLLERQEFQNRENEKKIRLLETERERLLAESPRKAGFERDISNLRSEINVLRRRAEDALEQKWQVEKGLVGLKMDLDRAEEEIASLRDVLKEHDILIPPSATRSGGVDGESSAPITSESLSRAYRELQDAYNESLHRIKRLQAEAGSGVADSKTEAALKRLEQSLSDAVSERDVARQQAQGLQTQVEVLAETESKSLGREKDLADEIGEAAQRIEELAVQVRKQLSANAELRKRLSDTVARGDLERKANSERISGLQERLHMLEEQLVAAQSQSEERVARHEEEIAQLREAHNEQLRRITSSAALSASKPLLPKSGAANMLARSTQTMATQSFEDQVQVEKLRARVTELEKTLSETEDEVQQVVNKMSEAQIQVMSLQEERETAVRETRHLQRLLEEEQSKAFQERFKTLNGMVV